MRAYTCNLCLEIQLVREGRFNLEICKSPVEKAGFLQGEGMKE